MENDAFGSEKGSRFLGVPPGFSTVGLCNTAYSSSLVCSLRMRLPTCDDSNASYIEQLYPVVLFTIFRFCDCASAQFNPTFVPSCLEHFTA